MNFEMPFIVSVSRLSVLVLKSMGPFRRASNIMDKQSLILVSELGFTSFQFMSRTGSNHRE